MNVVAGRKFLAIIRLSSRKIISYNINLSLWERYAFVNFGRRPSRAFYVFAADTQDAAISDCRIFCFDIMTCGHFLMCIFKFSLQSDDTVLGRHLNLNARLRYPDAGRTKINRGLMETLRICMGFAGLALLAACSSGGHQVSEIYSTEYYISHAAGNYQPPGPPNDPWGPYIKIAAERFDVPQMWIRQVMRAESGGHEYLNGQLTVSPAGAMGLMQLEPETYQEMAARYGLGADPFNPYNNVMAGTAYIHEMYTVYGSPGFLAAYNAGPGRLDSYMDYHTPLPHETTNYVAMIAPEIQGYYPARRSDADQLALNTLPASDAPGLLPPGVAPGGPPAPDMPGNPIAPVQFAAIVPAAPSESSIYAAEPVRSEPVSLPVRHSGFSLIASAMADTPTPHLLSGETSGTHWAIQVGVYSTRDKAKAALGIAELSAVEMLMHGQPVVVSVHHSSSTRYRARFVDLPHDDAVDACHHLLGGPTGCVILSPDAQR